MAEYIVRYGAMRFLGVFSAPAGQIILRDSKVIVRTDRGLEAGIALGEATPEAVARLIDPPSGQILRVMTHDDDVELARIKQNAREELNACARQIEKLNLQMKLVDVERIFGGERIVVYYLAENRVDFRELVKLLASEFQTRIEMRQIGVRDEAKLLADFGDCGCPVCCNTHLAQMPPVSMRMAKMQKATLDPTKISGRCGRLKCCLRYEFDTYEELQKEMPPVGSIVKTPEGTAKVVGQEILSGQVQVALEDKRRLLFAVQDVTVEKRPSRSAKQEAAAIDEETPAPDDELENDRPE